MQAMAAFSGGFPVGGGRQFPRTIVDAPVGGPLVVDGFENLRNTVCDGNAVVVTPCGGVGQVELGEVDEHAAVECDAGGM